MSNSFQRSFFWTLNQETNVPASVSIVGIEKNLSHLLVSSRDALHALDELSLGDSAVLCELNPTLVVLLVLSHRHYQTRGKRVSEMRTGGGKEGNTTWLDVQLYFSCLAFGSAAGAAAGAAAAGAAPVVGAAAAAGVATLPALAGFPPVCLFPISVQSRMAQKSKK